MYRLIQLAALPMRKELSILPKDTVISRTNPYFVLKFNTVFHLIQQLVLPSFCPKPLHPTEKTWHKLGMHRTLHIYLDRAKDFNLTHSTWVAASSAVFSATASVMICRAATWFAFVKKTVLGSPQKVPAWTEQAWQVHFSFSLSCSPSSCWILAHESVCARSYYCTEFCGYSFRTYLIVSSLQWGEVIHFPPSKKRREMI